MIRRFINAINATSNPIDIINGSSNEIIIANWLEANALCSTPNTGCPFNLGSGAAGYDRLTGSYWALIFNWQSGSWQPKQDQNYFPVPVYDNLDNP